MITLSPPREKFYVWAVIWMPLWIFWCYFIGLWNRSANYVKFNPCPAEPGYTRLFSNSVDPDHLASSEANWSGSALFAIKYMNLYQQSGSSNLKIGSGCGMLIYSAGQELIMTTLIYWSYIRGCSHFLYDKFCLSVAIRIPHLEILGWYYVVIWNKSGCLGKHGFHGISMFCVSPEMTVTGFWEGSKGKNISLLPA